MNAGRRPNRSEEILAMRRPILAIAILLSLGLEGCVPEAVPTGVCVVSEEPLTKSLYCEVPGRGYAIAIELLEPDRPGESPVVIRHFRRRYVVNRTTRQVESSKEYKLDFEAYGEAYWATFVETENRQLAALVKGKHTDIWEIGGFHDDGWPSQQGYYFAWFRASAAPLHRRHGFCVVDKGGNLFLQQEVDCNMQWHDATPVRFVAAKDAYFAVLLDPGSEYVQSILYIFSPTGQLVYEEVLKKSRGIFALDTGDDSELLLVGEGSTTVWAYTVAESAGEDSKS